jgi:UDP-glucose 4-epimerase
MIVLITGANGFIGTTIANVLSKENHKIFGIGRTDYSECELFDNYYKCDISKNTDIDDLIKKVPKCDVIVHVAAIISFDSFDSKMMEVNCNGTLQIGRFAIATGAKQIVYISSVPIISKPQKVPINENNNKDNPTTLYHLTKLMGEKILQLPEFNNIVMTVLRISAPISPNMPENRMLPLFLKKAMSGEPITLNGNGGRIQNYVDTRDIGKAVQFSILKCKSGLFLIGGQSKSNYEIALICNELCNSNGYIQDTGRIDPEEEYRWIISIEKSRKELGFKPEYSIKDTLIEMKKAIEKRI